jgi:hypothetical protein
MRPGLGRLTSRMAKRLRPDPVTLIIYGWHESEPGTLAWVFPSIGAALRGVRAMRNAVRWLIVSGRRGMGREGHEVDIDALRRTSIILVEGVS